jgi:hypothetical protein
VELLVAGKWETTSMLQGSLKQCVLAGALCLPVHLAPLEAAAWPLAPLAAQATAMPQRLAPAAQTARSANAIQRSCRRQVRRASGIIPGRRMRLPRAYYQFIDRCIAHGGVYT